MKDLKFDFRQTPTKNMIERKEQFVPEWRWNLPLFAILGICFLLIGYNEKLNLIVLGVSVIILIISIPLRSFIPLYFALVLFEPILVLPFGNASYFRIYQMLFVVNLLYSRHQGFKMTKSSDTMSKEAKVNFICMFLFLLSTVFYISDITTFMSYFVNFIILAYITYCVFRQQNNFEILLGVIVVFSAFSGLYGFLHNRYMVFEYGNRYFGTYGDPNYSAYFYMLGLIACLGSNRLPMFLRVMASLVLIVSLVSTISFAGIIGMGIFTLVYLFFAVSRRRALQILLVVVMLIGVMFLVPLESGSIFAAIQRRLYSVMGSHMDTLTSNRSSLFSSYLREFENLPVLKQLFGGLDILQGPYREEFVARLGNVSHNILVDMLFTVGITGTIVLSVSFLALLWSGFLRYRKSRWVNDLVSLMLKMCAIYFAVSLSIYPYRNFYSFLFMN